MIPESVSVNFIGPGLGHHVNERVLASKRELLDLLVLDHHSDVGGGGLGQGRRALHFHQFRDLADLQAQIDTSHLVHLEDDSRDLLLPTVKYCQCRMYVNRPDECRDDVCRGLLNYL